MCLRVNKNFLGYKRSTNHQRKNKLDFRKMKMLSLRDM